MKIHNSIILLFAFASSSNCQLSVNCVPDKGIKYAKTTSLTSAQGDENSGYQEVHYDTIGRVTLIKSSLDENTYRRVYEDGKLQLIITTRNELSDTAAMTRHNSDGEVAQLKHGDGALQIFEYMNCEREANVILSSEADTIQSFQTIFENGVVIKTIWTTYYSGKSNMVIHYYDYEFNGSGHWTKRKYVNGQGVVVEQRELIYYRS